MQDMGYSVHADDLNEAVDLLISATSIAEGVRAAARHFLEKCAECGWELEGGVTPSAIEHIAIERYVSETGSIRDVMYVVLRDIGSWMWQEGVPVEGAGILDGVLSRIS